MKSMFKSFSLLAVAACAGMSITSCNAEKDYYDPATAEQFVKAEYAANFVKRYGEVSPTQNWDLSTNQSYLATRAADEITIKSVAGLDFNVKNEIESYWKDNQKKYRVKSTIQKNENLYKNSSDNLPDSQKHEGEEAVLAAPANSFTIYPISAQGAYTYDMYVKVGNTEEVKVFTKNVTDYSKPYVNGMGYSVSNGNVIAQSMPGVTIKAPIGTPIQIYLKNIKNGSTSVTDKALGTGTGNAIFVDANVKPEGLDSSIMPENAILKYIGIEDNENYGDKDFNDLVLVIIGNPFTPEPIVIEEDEYTIPIAQPAKRYMIEDLGNTDDFDFNDIVVDVKDIVTGTYRYKKVNGVLVENELVKENHKQTATIIHRGGTIPFEVKVGNTILEGVEPAMYNDDEIKFTIEGWIPDENNVSVTVKGNGNDGVGVKEFGFPKIGEIPMIIATDLTVAPMEERTAIPESWWKK